MILSKLQTIVLAAVAATGLALAAGCQDLQSIDKSPSIVKNGDRPFGKEVTVETLRAGPIQMKFKDGQLRYLYVGNKEVVRRIFFAVRDGDWKTPMPVFSKCEVEQKTDSFKISLAATCKSDTVDYAWTGEIVGSADGQITFSVTGVPQKDFKSNRIGICVLYGADSLVGQKFQTLGVDGQSGAGTFPELVTMDLVAKDYKSLTYTTADGVNVSCSLTPILFTMEDQRNYGDSSFKAYNTVLTGPDALKGQSATVTATLKVTGAKWTEPAPGPVHVIIGKPLDGVRLPKLATFRESEKTGDFLSLNDKRNELKDQSLIAIGYKPSEHLPDDDTFMENRTAIFWQLNTLHTLAPKSRLRVTPRFTDKPDPRSTQPFASTWAVGALRQLALGHADEASFAMDISALDSLLEKYQVQQSSLLNVTVKSVGRAPVEVLALQKNGHIVLLIANSTTLTQKVRLEGLPLTSAAFEPLTIEVAPYGISSVVLDNPKP